MKDIWTYKPADTDQIEKIARILKCHRITATLLVNRGINTPEQAYAFLFPSLDHLSDPFSIKDMEKAASRIITAIENREKILVFGDFDADGVTATSLLNEFLSLADADITWYIPHRTKEGHGLEKNHIAMAADQDIDLIITVDCGSDSYEAVLAAAGEDIDVIVTDHHETPENLPLAAAVVNPKRKDCPSHLTHLAGVGVAFYLVIALRQMLRKKGFWKETQEPNLLQYCDLVAVGTIADMVPLKNENRILTRAGINIIKKGMRPGLRALTDLGRIDCRYMDAEDIAFKIAPKINAAGRISHARICVSLLTSREKTGAEQTADILDRHNKKRQQIELGILDDIEKKISSRPDILKKTVVILWDEKWHPGVLGIAASKISKKYARPAILISTAVHPASGSCRSTGTINIHDALCQCSGFLEKFGGHFMAAGLSINEKNLVSFSRALENRLNPDCCPPDFKNTFFLDCPLDIKDITDTLFNEIEKLKPFGMDNPEPVFKSSRVNVVSSYIIGAKHRKMILEQDGRKIEAIEFNIDNPDITPTFFKTIAFKIKINRFKNQAVPQIIIEHKNF
ncbi:MAG: single-stranded-DNA-specific exonuclease RecJ [Thermodesulfobacteriota bacterium]|nr:single-stranded-DNA-specific exonuclease RecJ [Thermodesulfobacteriota bacterium]